jgi:hypothetical protein
MTKVNPSFESVKSEILNAAVMTITPMIARQWLDSTDHSIQRRLSISHVSYLAKEMKNGYWDLNGQPIQIDKKGNVVNGQHRLNACIESGCDFQSLVVFNVETSAIKTIDEGSKARGISDFLEIKYNPKHSTTVSSAMKTIFFWDAGWKKTLKDGGERGGKNPKLSPAEAQEFIKANPGFFDFIVEAVSLHQSGDKLLSPSLFCSMLWIVERENPVYSRDFFAKLSNGISIGPKCPIAYLRKILMEDARKRAEMGRRLGRLTKGDVVSLIVKAFNYYVEGVEVTKLIQIPKDVPDIIRSKRA